MNFRLNTLSVCLFSLGCFFSLHCSYAEEILDNVVVTVNDTALTRTKIEQQLQKELTPRPGSAIPQGKSFKRHVIEEMIKNELEWQIAKRFVLNFPQNELNTILEKEARARNIALETEQAKEEFKREILLNDLRQSQIRAFLMQEPTDFEVQMQLQSLPKEEKSVNEVYYHIERLLIPNNRATHRGWWQYLKALFGFKKTNIETVQKQELQNVLLRAKNARSFSEILNANQLKNWEMIDLGWRTEAQLPSLYLDAIRVLKSYEISHPLQAPNGLHIIRLLGKKGSMSIEKVHLRQILLKTDGLKKDSVLEKKLKTIRHTVLKYNNFQEQAEKYSEDPDSALQQGDLGWVDMNDLEAAVKVQVKQLSLNQISQPFKTSKGWCLIQVIERKTTASEANMSQYDQAKMMVQQQKAMKALEEWRQTLYDKAYIRWIDPDFASE